jgi:iron complex outermembrane recepter protein
MNRPLLFRARAAATYLLAYIFGSSLLIGQTAPKPADNPEAEKSITLERFEVTGSRVKRLDYETPSPVVTYTAQVIEEKGFASLGEFVATLPFNQGTSTNEFTSAAAFITGAATVNLRGLGANRFLTLVNSRRTVPYAITNQASGTAQSNFNFNSIPSGAIDRIDFLKDGASAIYGSDAITGVFNIILKKNYEGSSVDLTVGNTIHGDGLFRRVNVFSGISRNGWEISGGISVQSRHSVFLQDFGTQSADFRYLGAKGQNLNSVIALPSPLWFANVAAAQAAGFNQGSGYYYLTNGATTNPTRASFTYAGASANIPESLKYNSAPDTQLYPESEYYSGFLNVNRRVGSWATVFSTFLYNRANIHYVLVPYGFTTTQAGLVLPATNPYNPTGQTIVYPASGNPWFFRSEVPHRELKSDTYSGVIGLRGTALRIWNWETGLNYGGNEATRDTDAIAAATLQERLNGTTRETAFNLFGESPANHNLFTRSRGLDGKASSFTYDLSVNGSFYQLPWEGGGELGLAAGVEYRHDTLRSNPEPRQFLGISQTFKFDSTRDARSAYVELSVPVKKWLEFQLAGRHERYSDFGNTTKPKFSGKLRLPETRLVNVVLRGSYSESFKAPDLGQLYQPQSFGFTGSQYLDPLRPQDTARTLRQLVGGNPALQPENGKVKYGGFVFEVPAVKGLSFSADYFDIQVTKAISVLSASYLLSSDGRRNFPNAIVRDPTGPQPGQIQHLLLITNNLGLQLYRGWDLGARYNLRNTRWGSFNFNVDVTNTMKRGSDANQGAGFGDATGYYFAPEWRYNYGLTWRYKNWGASVYADVIGQYFNDRQSTATFDGWGENPYTIVTPTVTYRGFKKMTVSVGINNVFDNRPPPNGFLAYGYDDRTYGPGVLGLNWTVRVRKDF